jgi:predicted HicB family RNase H-like nuclease
MQEGGDTMPTTKAGQKAVNKYMRENYDRVNLTMPKGRKDEVKAHADTRGESLNAFINRAIDMQIQRDTASHTEAE